MDYVTFSSVAPALLKQQPFSVLPRRVDWKKHASARMACERRKC